jgi:hypothetical protein
MSESTEIAVNHVRNRSKHNFLTADWSFNMPSFVSAETAQPTLNAGKNTEVKQFKYGRTGIRLCDLP